MRVWWLTSDQPRDELWRRLWSPLKTVVLLTHIITIAVNAIGCGGCIHDVLRPTRGTSPQEYVLDFRTLIQSDNKLSNKEYYSTNPPQETQTSQTNQGYVLRYQYQHRYTSVSDTKSRPKRYVEDDKNGDEEGASNSTTNTSAPGRRRYNRRRPKIIPRGNLVNQTNVTNSSYQIANVEYRKLFKPIRIKLFFDDEHIEYANTSAEYKRLNESLVKAVKKMEQILSVIPVEGPLLFSRTPARICGNFWSELSSAPDSKKERRCAIAHQSYVGEKCLDDFKIPEDHLRGYPIYKNNTDTPTHMLYENGTGLPDTDTVIYIHTEKTSLCKDKDVIAYATFCQLDQHSRPVAGFANFCPDYLADILYDEDVLYLTSLHEFFHALGFSKDLFDKFQECRPKVTRKSNDDSENEKDKNTPSIEWTCEDRRKTVSFIENRKHIVTPAVTRETQRHLNCSSKRGCPLENHVVPPLLTSSHWEGRFMQGSLMAPTIGMPHLTVIDRITLGAFEDMGWYQVDYNQAEDLPWGRNAGCEFATGTTCFNASSPYFCQRSRGSIQNGCHYLHLDKGRCESDDYLENCKVYKARAGMECWMNKNETRLSEWKGEIYSHKSRCFLSDLVLQTTKFQPISSAIKLEGRCYLHRCNNSATLEVQVSGSEWKVCPEGSYVKFDGYKGQLRCPSVSLLCGYNFDETTAPSVGPTGVTHPANSFCAKITITFPKLAELHYQIRSREKRPELAREAQHKLDMFIAKFVNEIVAVTDIDETRIVDIKFISSIAVEFMLLKDLDWTTLTPKDPLSSLSPSDYDADDSAGNIVAYPLRYNYREVSCTEAVKRLLVSVSEGNFKVPVDGNLYKANKINFTSSEDETNKLHNELRHPTEKPRSTGMLAAIAVGSVCGAVLIAVGVMIYWKSQITTAITPAPPTPTSADVRYQPNNGTTVAPSENGSLGQLTFVA